MHYCSEFDERDYSKSFHTLSLKEFFNYTELSYSELVSIFANNNSNYLTYLNQEECFALTDRLGNGVLHLSIIFDRIEIFDYALSSKNLQINQKNQFGQTPLVLACRNKNIYYFQQLLKHGADVQTREYCDFTVLHASASGSLLILQHLLDNQLIDINVETYCHLTPLHLACDFGSVEHICMLLCYGADVNVLNCTNFSPFHVLLSRQYTCLKNGIKFKLDLDEIFYNYIYEDTYYDKCTSLKTFYLTLSVNSTVFDKIVKITNKISFCNRDLAAMCKVCILSSNLENIKLFSGKFKKTFYKVITYFDNNLLGLVKYFFNDIYDGSSERYDIFLNYLDYIIEIFPNFSTNLFKNREDPGQLLIFSYISCEKRNEDAITKLICWLLSYNCLNIYGRDLFEIFSFYGWNQLFKILLHLEVLEVLEQDSLMLTLITHPHIQFRKFYMENISNPILINLAKTDLIYRHFNELEQKVCSLLQLSRDASREYIVNRFKIENFNQFYTILNCLPINNVYKKIISFEKCLYDKNSN